MAGIDADRAQKHGMDEFISANPCSFDHASLFDIVQRLTLDHRLNDNFACLVSVFLLLTSMQSNYMQHFQTVYPFVGIVGMV